MSLAGFIFCLSAGGCIGIFLCVRSVLILTLFLVDSRFRFATRVPFLIVALLFVYSPTRLAMRTLVVVFT